MKPATVPVSTDCTNGTLRSKPSCLIKKMSALDKSKALIISYLAPPPESRMEYGELRLLNSGTKSFIRPTICMESKL